MEKNFEIDENIAGIIIFVYVFFDRAPILLYIHAQQYIFYNCCFLFLFFFLFFYSSFFPFILAAARSFTFFIIRVTVQHISSGDRERQKQGRGSV